MSVSDELAAYLAGKGLGTLGTNLFYDNMPETPNVCGCVYQTGGTSPQGGFSTPGIKHERPGVQIRFRGEPYDSDSPKTKAMSAYEYLMQVQGTQVGGVTYLMVIPNQAPFVLEKDGNNRITWAFNAVAEKEPS